MAEMMKSLAVPRRLFEKKPAAPVVSSSAVSSILAIAFLVLHIPLALLIKDSPELAQVHAYGAIIVALVFAFSKGAPHRVAYALAYIASAEVLWRMAKAPIYWEFGKYATILVIIAVLWRMRSFRIPLLPIIYLIMLLPSTILTLMKVSFSTARGLISFNLSGPTSLFFAATFFSNVRITQRSLQYICIALVAPTICVATIALEGIVSAPEINWIVDSNSATSGGYGPNQVSTTLGMGLLAVWLMIFCVKNTIVSRVVLVPLALWLAIQTLLTFSRGVMIGAVLAIAATLIITLINRQVSISRIIFTVIGFALFITVALPIIDDFTQGALNERYSAIAEGDTSGRDRIAETELEIFFENPFLGIGLGLGKSRTGIVTHTEFTRMLSEHGIFGILSMSMMALMGLHVYSKNRGNSAAQAIGVALIIWTLFYMTNAGMRSVAPSFMFGLACAQFYLGDKTIPDSKPVRRKLRHEF